MNPGTECHCTAQYLIMYCSIDNVLFTMIALNMGQSGTILTSTKSWKITHYCSGDYHYDDVTMSLMASQITSLTILYSTVYSGADQRKHQSSASLVFVRGIHRGPVNSPHKGPVTRKMFPFDDVIMTGLGNDPKITIFQKARKTKGASMKMYLMNVLVR